MNSPSGTELLYDIAEMDRTVDTEWTPMRISPSCLDPADEHQWVNLLAAAQAANARRFLAQSIAWELPPGEGADGVRELKRSVLDASGVVLRYGQFYGPGTYFEEEPPPPPRVHIEAAARTVAALDAPSGIITVVED